jgi:hypothetical protein
VENLDAEMTPYEYSFCTGEVDKKLKSFQLIYADPSGEQKIALPRAGPETGNCTTAQF